MTPALRMDAERTAVDWVAELSSEQRLWLSSGLSLGPGRFVCAAHPPRHGRRFQGSGRGDWAA
jgi:hypothetical protein